MIIIEISKRLKSISSSGLTEEDYFAILKNVKPLSELDEINYIIYKISVIKRK